LTESSRWKDAKKAYDIAPSKKNNLAQILTGSNLKALIWTTTIYLFWNLAAGTAGAFNPYIISTLNAGSQAASTALSSASFVITMIVTITIFMKFSDKNLKTRKLIWGVGAVMQIVAYGLFLYFDFNLTSVVANIVLFSAGAALAGEAFYKVFSQELFPTMLRGTAQGFSFGVARVLLGFWSFFVPVLAHAGIKQIALLLTVFLTISGVVGYFFMPDTSGKSLEQIENERGTAVT
jgi:inositol transporter-like SP family MFS transporter